jgi:hypothetical protein
MLPTAFGRSAYEPPRPWCLVVRSQFLTIEVSGTKEVRHACCMTWLPALRPAEGRFFLVGRSRQERGSVYRDRAPMATRCVTGSQTHIGMTVSGLP